MANRFTISAFAARLRSARAAAGLTIQAASDRSGVHFVSIARFEKGRRVPTIPTLCKLADAYGVPPGDLIAPSGAAEATRPGTDGGPRG